MQNYMITHITKKNRKIFLNRQAKKCVKVLLTDILPHAKQMSVLTPHLRVLFNYYTTYTKVTEGSPMEGGDDDTRGFPLSTILCLSSPSGLHQEANSFFLATGGYYTASKPNIPLRGMARLKANKWE